MGTWKGNVLPERRAGPDEASLRRRHAVYQHEGQEEKSVLLSQPIFLQAMNVLVVIVAAGLF